MSIVFIIIQFIIEVLLGSLTGKFFKEDVSSLKKELIQECVKIEKELRSFEFLLAQEKVKVKVKENEEEIVNLKEE